MLYLLPNLLYKDAPHEEQFPISIDRAVADLDGLIAEHPKEAYRYANHFQRKDLPIALLNEHTSAKELEALIVPLKNQENWGLISDAGLPCLADPGSQLVCRARELGIPVKAFIGPSSFVLALMLSGLGAQRFCFHGYLPREEEKRRKALKDLETRAKKEDATQLFIETPYRNQALLASALFVLEERTKFAVAVDLTAPCEIVYSQSIRDWKTKPLPNIEKRPAVFLLR